MANESISSLLRGNETPEERDAIIRDYLIRSRKKFDAEHSVDGSSSLAQPAVYTDKFGQKPGRDTPVGQGPTSVTVEQPDTTPVKEKHFDKAPIKDALQKLGRSVEMKAEPEKTSIIQALLNYNRPSQDPKDYAEPTSPAPEPTPNSQPSKLESPSKLRDDSDGLSSPPLPNSFARSRRVPDAVAALRAAQDEAGNLRSKADLGHAGATLAAATGGRGYKPDYEYWDAKSKEADAPVSDLLNRRKLASDEEDNDETSPANQAFRAGLKADFPGYFNKFPPELFEKITKKDADVLFKPLELSEKLKERELEVRAKLDNANDKNSQDNVTARGAFMAQYPDVVRQINEDAAKTGSPPFSEFTGPGLLNFLKLKMSADTTARTQTETERHNTETEGLTARGQNLTDRQKRDQLAFEKYKFSNRHLGEVAGAEKPEAIRKEIEARAAKIPDGTGAVLSMTNRLRDIIKENGGLDNIQGVGIIQKYFPTIALNTQGQTFRQALAMAMNAYLKQTSGAAVTDSEMVRNMAAIISTGDAAAIDRGISNLRGRATADFRQALAGAHPEAIQALAPEYGLTPEEMPKGYTIGQGKNPPPAGGPAKVRVQKANGQTGSIDAAKVDAFLKANPGSKVIKDGR